MSTKKNEEKNGKMHGGEMYTAPRLTLYIMHVNIMQIGFGLFLVWLMPSDRATILEHMTAAHVHALHWMWQRLQPSNTSCHIWSLIDSKTLARGV